MRPRTVIIIITLGAAYAAWRVQESQREGGPVTWKNPLDLLLPGPPSPAAPEGVGETNPDLMALWFPVGMMSTKMPGNAPARAATPSDPATRVDPLWPPSTLTYTAQPETLYSGMKYVPNLGDPNTLAWAYLASTPPDLAWGLVGVGVGDA